ELCFVAMRHYSLAARQRAAAGSTECPSKRLQQDPTMDRKLSGAEVVRPNYRHSAMKYRKKAAYIKPPCHLWPTRVWTAPGSTSDLIFCSVLRFRAVSLLSQLESAFPMSWSPALTLLKRSRRGI